MKKAATKRSKKRPIKQQQIIVLMDGAGNYYEIPRATLEEGRVSDDRKKKVAAALDNVEIVIKYIKGPSVPGSIAAPEYVKGMLLHYAGFYLSSTKTKR